MGNQPSNGTDGAGGARPGPGHSHHRPQRPGQHPHAGPQGAGGVPTGTSGYPGGPPGYNPYGTASPGQVHNHAQGQGHSQHSNHHHPSNMHPSTSDASMGDNDKSSSSNAQPHTPSVMDPNVQAHIAQLSFADDDVVPTVFRWEHGGRDVYITGTFNDWTRQIPMHRSGNDFTYIHNLKRGKHAFKFIVDDEWRFAPDQPTVADIDGRINNFIDVTDFKPYTGDKSFEQEKNAAYYAKPHSNRDHGAAPSSAAGGAGHMAIVEDDSMTPDGHGGHHIPNGALEDPDGEVFTHTMPDLDDYTKDPPPLPPHLRHIILNKPPQLQDTAALPVPQHVALNHLYCTAIRDNMMVLGITQRFKTKFVTTVYYSPELSRV